MGGKVRPEAQQWRVPGPPCQCEPLGFGLRRGERLDVLRREPGDLGEVAAIDRGLRHQLAADATKQATQDMAKGLEAMAQGMAAAGAATGDGKPVDPVSFHDLQALFPDLDGWTKGKPHGERMTAPFPYSQADVSYEKGDSRLELKIIDSANHQLLVAPYTMFLAAGYEKETDNGYEKSTKVGGEPGWEKWDSEAKHGELNAIVGKRYIIQTTGSNIADNKVLQDLVAKTDLSKLAAMK